MQVNVPESMWAHFKKQVAAAGFCYLCSKHAPGHADGCPLGDGACPTCGGTGAENYFDRESGASEQYPCSVCNRNARWPA